MNLPFAYQGLTFLPCLYLTETKRVSRQERKWAHRVMFQRARRFRDQYRDVATDQVIVTDGKAYAHPQTIARIAAALENRP